MSDQYKKNVIDELAKAVEAQRALVIHEQARLKEMEELLSEIDQ